MWRYIETDIRHRVYANRVRLVTTGEDCPVLWCCRKCIAYARDVVQCCGVVESVLPMPGMLSSVVVL